MQLFLFIFTICLTKSSLILTAPCEINDETGLSSARVEFDENTQPGSVIFNLPFDGTSSEIEEIRMKSNELEDDVLNKYFKLKFKNLVLNSHYDLSEIEMDFIEILLTCVPKTGNLSQPDSVGDAKNFMTKNSFLLYITINDVNDKTPEFFDTPYSFSLRELTPVGSIVYQNIRAIDRDVSNRPNSQITFSIEKGPFSDYFEFPLTTKSDIAVTKPIQYDVFSKCNLTIKATDHGQPQLSSLVTIEIEIIDIDDKDPVFTSSFYKGFVARNSPVGSVVEIFANKIYAYDQDVGINMTLKYSLGNNPDELFAIDEDIGEIKLTSSIRDLNVREFNLIVKASQTDNQLRAAMSMVNLKMIDINNHAPVFESKAYEVSIFENTELNTVVCEVHATDADENQLEYSIVSNHEFPFIVERQKGVIRVNGRLDYEMKSKYLIEVIVSDGKHTGKSQVTINVINLVDKAPHFEYNYYNFKIKIPYDVYVGQIKATDVENTGNLSYTIKFNDANDSSLFCITQTGTIYLCSSVITPKTSDLASMDALLAQFHKDEYTFNVSVRIFSPDLSVELENHVECKIQIESKQLGLDSSSSANMKFSLDRNEKTSSFRVRTATKGVYQTTRPPNLPVLFMNEQMFKDATTVYVLIGIITGTLVIMLFCASVFMWFKCRKFSKKCHRHRHSSHVAGSVAMILNNENKYSKKSLKAMLGGNKMPFDLLDKQQHTVDKRANSSGICSGSSNLSEGAMEHHNHHINIASSKDSTSSGVSCVSSCSNCSKISKRHSGLENHMFYSQWQEKMVDATDTNQAKNVNDSSPISKITMLSEYILEHNELQTATNSSNNIIKMNIQSKPYLYAEQINHETPILAICPPEYIYEENHFANTCYNATENAAKPEGESLEQSNKAYTTTFKKQSSNCCLPKRKHSKDSDMYNNSLLTTTEIQNGNTSPKLLSFLPPNSNFYEQQSLNDYRLPRFNQQEPLTVNSETNIENSEFIRASDNKSICEENANKHHTPNPSSHFSSFLQNSQSNSGKEEDEVKFHSHIDNCNTSLVKLVNIIHRNNQEEESVAMEKSSAEFIDDIDYVYEHVFSNDHKHVKISPDYPIKLINNSKPPLGFRDSFHKPESGFNKSIETETEMRSFRKDETKTEFIITKINLSATNAPRVSEEVSSVTPNSPMFVKSSMHNSYSSNLSESTTTSELTEDGKNLSRVSLIKQKLGIELQNKLNSRNLKT